MTLKSICVRCQRFYRPKKNGICFVEQMPNRKDAVPGVHSPDHWQPYKLWSGDLWSCHGCGHELIVGVAKLPLAEHYQDGFADAVISHNAEVRVNDC